MNIKRWFVISLVCVLIAASFPSVTFAAPAPPSNFRLHKAFTISVVLDWNKPPYTVSKYIVYYTSSAGSGSIQVTTDWALVDRLTAGTLYNFNVRAVLPDGSQSTLSPTVTARTNSLYTKFSRPIQGGSAGANFDHEGIDFFAAVGTKCIAAATGKVSSISADPWDSTQKVVQIRLDTPFYYDGFQATRVYYSHMKTVQVSVGQQVTAGQTVIGTSGTANNTPHLHFGIVLVGTNTYTYPNGVVTSWGSEFSRDQSYALLGLSKMGQ